MSGKRKQSGYGCGSILLFFLMIGLLMEYWPIILLIFFVIFTIAFLCWIKLKNSPFGNINFDAMDDHEFEYFCSELLKKNGFKQVKVTKESGDHGVDVLANLNGRKYAIQSKRYGKNVGNKAVQEAFSGRAIYGAELWDRRKLLQFIRSADKKNGEINNE